PGSESERKKTKPPVRHAWLQNHGGQTDLLIAELPAAQRQILPEAAIHVVRRPAPFRWREFRDDLGRQLRIQLLQLLDGSGDQVIRARCKQDLDLRFQTNDCRRALRVPVWWSLQSASACRQKAVETG